MKASEFAQLIPACCSEVLDAMYFTSVLETSACESPVQAIDPKDSAFSLHFSGEISGDFALHMGPAMARSLASNFLGEEEDTLSPAEVGEVAAELANMLCGSVVSRLPCATKFILSSPRPMPSLPEAAGALVTRLDTDYGAITLWVAVEGDA
jgi:CheY-specific phosphatase CheX